ncbi:Ras GTPase [Acrasis kona]|uniref:Ras GTPase n=1 Tax=Acrasis kona TaxID=1008807 RepID=A0AAW2YND7_9EUKA
MNKLKKTMSTLLPINTQKTMSFSKSLDSIPKSPKSPSSTMNFRIAVIGAENTGKTQIIKMFCSGEFNDFYDETIEDTYYRVCHFDIQSVMPPTDVKDESNKILGKLQIFDTSGNPSLKLSEEQIATCDGFILVYAYGDDMSYERTKMDYERIIQKRGNDVAVVLVENKYDVETLEMDIAYLEREIERPFYRTSAKLMHNIDDCFNGIVCEMVRYKFVVPFAQLGTYGKDRTTPEQKKARRSAKLILTNPSPTSDITSFQIVVPTEQFLKK